MSVGLHSIAHLTGMYFDFHFDLMFFNYVKGPDTLPPASHHLLARFRFFLIAVFFFSADFMFVYSAIVWTARQTIDFKDGFISAASICVSFSFLLLRLAIIIWRAKEAEAQKGKRKRAKKKEKCQKEGLIKLVAMSLKRCFPPLHPHSMYPFIAVFFF